MNALFDRDGHITELTFNRLNADETFDGKLDVQEHIDDCDVCAKRQSDIVALDATFSIAPPANLLPEKTPDVAPVVSLEERRSSKWGLVGVVALAACAVLAIGFFTQNNAETGLAELGEEGPDIVRIKGDGFRMDLFVADEKGSREVGTGEEVHPGDRVGFRVANAKDGYVLIAGVDETGSVYPCYPQRSTNAKFAPESLDGRDLKTAIQLDDVLGRERIVGAFCPQPFTMNDVAGRIRGPSIDGTADDSMEGCSFEEVTLVKKPK